MAVTIKDIAKKAQLSPATVSRVVGNYGYVSEETRSKVLTAIEELGYRPNAIARSMVKRATTTIGLVVTDITNPFFAHLARGVEDVTWAQGYTSILANTDEDPEREQAIIRVLREKQVDGLIVVPASSRSATHLSEMAGQGTALVLVDRLVADCPVDTVMVNNEEGAYQAVSYLIQLGRQRIGMIFDNPDISTNMERLAGYRRALTEAGIRMNDSLAQSCQYTQQSAYELVVWMLHQPEPPDALFTANNFMTLGALQAIHEARLDIPKDVAVVGFDDLDSSALLYPHVPTVKQPIHDLGKVAAQRLLARISQKDDSPPQQIRLLTRFVINDSDSHGDDFIAID